jgi:F420H(2)-dependent quinone reductase
MTAVNREQVQVKPAPRPLLRLFWAMHRALYRVTGGRIGLQRPERGAKFGMLRLHTVGRKSGQKRIAMIGYYEDGPNLVTLAMNGWGKTEPAWWLNLQANGSATVEMPDGRRQVRGRAAVGAERERLWAKFAEYPGWGSDIGALAAHRPGETAIVVLEPKGAQDR